MSWNITYYDQEPENYKIGDMWPEPGFAKSTLLSERYHHEVASKRPPLIVILPSIHNKHGDRFPIDRCYSDDPRRRGWDITINGDLVNGQQPDITLNPSINCVGSYHGYIRNGVITDDCEGRTYQD